MLEIKFDDYYRKMPVGFEESELMQVFCVWVDSLSDVFVNWDTRKRDGTYCELPENGFVLVLLFRTRSTGLMWTTIRRFADDMHRDYWLHVGEYFKCIVTEAK